ncbi:MAG: hypothetical protein Q7S81_02055 [bacterium]|nr:hypothetical protein [bacterium]
MVEKLRSVWKIVQLRLILKSLIFAGLLLWVKTSGFGALPVFVFILMGFILYFRNHSQNNLENIHSFSALLLVSMFSISLLSHFQFIFPAIIFFSVLFYLMLGIKEFYFVRRYEWNSVKNTLLIFSIFLVYFMSNKYTFFYLKYLAVFVVIFFLIKEWLFWLEPNFPKRYNFIAFVFSFLVLQLSWAVSILPLGFLNSASLMTVFVYIMFDSCTDYLKGVLTKKQIIKNFIILALSFIAIFIFTKFSI